MAIYHPANYYLIQSKLQISNYTLANQPTKIKLAISAVPQFSQ